MGLDESLDRVPGVFVNNRYNFSLGSRISSGVNLEASSLMNSPTSVMMPIPGTSRLMARVQPT